MVVLKEVFKLYYNSGVVLKDDRREFLALVIKYLEFKIPKPVVEVLKYGYSDKKSTERVKVKYWAEKIGLSEDFLNSFSDNDNLMFEFQKNKFIRDHDLNLVNDTKNIGDAFSKSLVGLDVPEIELSESELEELKSKDFREVIKLLVPYSRNYQTGLFEMYGKEIYYLKCVYNGIVNNEALEKTLKGVL